MYLSRAHDSHDLAVLSPVMLAPHYDTMKKFVVANLMTAPEVTETNKQTNPRKHHPTPHDQLTSPKIHRNIQGAISNDDEDDVMMSSSNLFLEISPQNLTSF
jgi:hypothetical protein